MDSILYQRSPESLNIGKRGSNLMEIVSDVRSLVGSRGKVEGGKVKDKK